MSEYVAAALFVHTDDTKNLIKQLQNNASGTRVTPVAFEALMRSPKARLEGVEHVVVAGSLEVIKEMMRLAATHHYSMGIIPTKEQIDLIKFYGLPKDSAAADGGGNRHRAAGFPFLLRGLFALFDQSGRHYCIGHLYFPDAGLFRGGAQQAQSRGRIYFPGPDRDSPLFILPPHRGRSDPRKKLAE